MPLVAAGQTKGWIAYLQLTDGNFLRAAPTDRLRFSGALATEPLNPTNSSTHLFASNDTSHLCSTTHAHNTKRLTGTTVSIDGAASSALPVAKVSCPLLLTFFSLSEIVTSNARIYAYDGLTDATPMAGVNIYMAEGGVSTSWSAANGSANVLNLANHTTPAVDHDFFIACSMDTVGGAGTTSTGAFKILISYV